MVAESFARLAEDIRTQGWSCCDEFLAGERVAQLRDEACAAQSRGEFRAAAVGAGARRAVRFEVRGDDIHWLTPPFSTPVEHLMRQFEELRLALNRALALGLFGLELHFARYRPGSYYARHLDQLTGSTSRVLSLALYLNNGWRAEEGGALRLHLPAGSAAPHREFLPQAGRLVLFLSAQFEHEVLPATRERLSITGWFRRRDEAPWAPH